MLSGDQQEVWWTDKYGIGAPHTSLMISAGPEAGQMGLMVKNVLTLHIQEPNEANIGKLNEGALIRVRINM